MPEESHEQQGLLPDSRHADDRDHGDDHDHDEHGADAEDDDQGFSYSKNMSIPTSSNPHRGDANDVVFDGDEELQHLEREAPPGADAVPVPYAHRDLKPAWVLLSYIAIWLR
jgi:serine/threonine kinase 16